MALPGACSATKLAVSQTPLPPLLGNSPPYRTATQGCPWYKLLFGIRLSRNVQHSVRSVKSEQDIPSGKYRRSPHTERIEPSNASPSLPVVFRLLLLPAVVLSVINDDNKLQISGSKDPGSLFSALLALSHGIPPSKAPPCNDGKHGAPKVPSSLLLDRLEQHMADDMEAEAQDFPSGSARRWMRLNGGN